MGTAGGASNMQRNLIRERTVVFNGDILTDLDLEAVLREHEKRGATATVVLTPFDNPVLTAWWKLIVKVVLRGLSKSRNRKNHLQ